MKPLAAWSEEELLAYAAGEFDPHELQESEIQWLPDPPFKLEEIDLLGLTPDEIVRVAFVPSQNAPRRFERSAASTAEMCRAALRCCADTRLPPRMSTAWKKLPSAPRARRTRPALRRSPRSGRLKAIILRGKADELAASPEFVEAWRKLFTTIDADAVPVAATASASPGS